ncbi:MAG: SPOR domain-containing protein, partial [Thermocrispum sp.]
HVGSFQNERAGLAVVGRLQESGHEAYLAPVDLAGRGRWFRVFVGAFSDSTAAREARAGLLRSEVVEEAVVRPTPWTYELGSFATREEAERRRGELRRQGITAYLAGSGPVRLYTGAYATREEAAALAPVLDDRAGTATLTRRDL